MYPHSISLINRISEQVPKMSKGQKAIAAFILDSYDQAAYLTAAKIGEEAGVSESTVVRFAMELGFEGFPHFQKELQEELKAKLTFVQRLKASFSLAVRDDIPGAVLQSDLEKIRKTSSQLDRDSFNQAVDAILSASKVYILGMRSSASLASFLNFYFNLIFDNIKLVQATGISEMFEQILPIGQEDVLFAISFPRYSSHTIKAMNYAESNGAKVIALTDKVESPIAQNADISLLAPSDMMSFADSLVAPLSVINALIAVVSFKRQQHVLESLEKLERIWDEYDIYDKGDLYE